MYLMNKSKSIKTSLVPFLCVFPLFSLSPVFAQEEEEETETVFELTPFEVNTDREYGYRANTSVSGTRTATAVRDLPFSLQIVTDELIDDMNVTDLEDALLYTSGVQENRDNVGNFGKFNVRGIQQNYTLRNGFRHYGPNDTSAIAQVEVVKGPAGLLYGQVFPGGVVNAVSKKPLTISKYELEVQYGSYGSFRSELDAGGPLNKSKTLSYRLIGSYSDWNSFVDHYARRIKSVVPMISYSPFDKIKFTFEFERYISDEDSPHAGRIAINENDLATAIANPEDPFRIKNGPFNTQVIRSQSLPESRSGCHDPSTPTVRVPSTFMTSTVTRCTLISSSTTTLVFDRPSSTRILIRSDMPTSSTIPCGRALIFSARRRTRTPRTKW